MSETSDTESGISVAGISSHFLEPTRPGYLGPGRLRYITGGTGAPLVMLHTVAPRPSTSASSFRGPGAVHRVRARSPRNGLLAVCPAPPIRSPPGAPPSRASSPNSICAT